MPAEQRALTSGELSKMARSWWLAISLKTPSKTGAAGDCCVEGRRRVAHRAEAACGWFALRVPHGETSRRAGCLNRARPVRWAGMGNGAMPNGPSYRAHPRLYLFRCPNPSDAFLLLGRLPLRTGVSAATSEIS